jgi:ubiquinone/menaquinone biosynthesis C-methylase UbiE
VRVATRVDFDEVSTTYHAALDEQLKVLIGGEPSDYYLRLKVHETLAQARRLGLEPARGAILDVGCGTGRMVELLHPHFARVAGVEPSAGMLEGARERGLGDGVFARASAERLPFDDASFDIVYSSCVFHHADRHDHTAMVREMGRVLRPGGVLLTYEHNPWNPLTRLVVSRCPVDRGVVLCRPGEIRHAYTAAGLGRIETRFIVFFPRLLRAARRLEPSLHRVPLGGQYYVSGLKA